MLVCCTGKSGIAVWWVGRKRRIRAEYEYIGNKKKINDNVEK